ncbi:hypothetical protein [Candidatus Mycobacterium methanotrophicum]
MAEAGDLDKPFGTAAALTAVTSTFGVPSGRLRPTMAALRLPLPAR